MSIAFIFLLILWSSSTHMKSNMFDGTFTESAIVWSVGIIVIASVATFIGTRGK